MRIIKVKMIPRTDHHTGNIFKTGLHGEEIMMMGW